MKKKTTVSARKTKAPSPKRQPKEDCCQAAYRTVQETIRRSEGK